MSGSDGHDRPRSQWVAQAGIVALDDARTASIAPRGHEPSAQTLATRALERGSGPSSERAGR